MSETWPYGQEWWCHDPLEKNLLNLYALLRKQGKLLRHCKRQCAEPCGEMIQQTCAVTNSSEFRKMYSRTRLSNRRELEKIWVNKTAESSDSVENAPPRIWPFPLPLCQQGFL